jgi:hypothetical protein
VPLARLNQGLKLECMLGLGLVANGRVDHLVGSQAAGQSVDQLRQFPTILSRVFIKQLSLLVG